MGKVLKMIADWRYSKKPVDTRDWQDIDLTERDNNSWWYLHGELEKLVGFDKATVTNCKSGGFAKETINWANIDGNEVTSVISEDPCYQMYFNGEVNVEIEGISRPCVGFFYTSSEQPVYYKGKEYLFWEQRGLVCFSDDLNAVEYARSMMKQRSRNL